MDPHLQGLLAKVVGGDLDIINCNNFGSFLNSIEFDNTLLLSITKVG